jgi:peptidoglycan/LPS O-acetylase OafA/YrhL
MKPGSETNTSNTSMRLHGLDGLRGLAALAVFGVHYNQIIDVETRVGPFDFYLLLANGEYGVALFFILSGFLLSQPFWKSMLNAAPWPDTRTYVIRRLARIVPAYYLALTILILLAGYWRYPQAWTDILLHYSFLFNYAEFSIFSINPPFWTLAVEVQFYCLLPLLFVLIRRCSLRSSIAVLILLSLLAYGLNYWLITSIDQVIPWPWSTALTWVRPYAAVVTHSLLAHLPHFMIGVGCGGLWLHLKTTRTQSVEMDDLRYEVIFWVSFILVFLLLATELGDSIQIPYGRYGLPLVPLLLGAMIISTPQTRVARKLLDSRALRILGTLSYGVYIYHLPVLRLVDQRMMQSALDAREHWLMLGVISLLLSLLAATISYFVVERPVLKLAHRKTS